MKILLTTILTLLSLSVYAKTESTSPPESFLASCSEEAIVRLSKLEIKGEQRFSEFKFADKITSVSEVEFTDLGGSGRRKRRGKKPKEVAPAKQQFGHIIIFGGQAKEKESWRNINIKCGINKSKIATFTYELLEKTPAGKTPADKTPEKTP